MNMSERDQKIWDKHMAPLDPAEREAAAILLALSLLIKTTGRSGPRYQATEQAYLDLANEFTESVTAMTYFLAEVNGQELPPRIKAMLDLIAEIKGKSKPSDDNKDDNSSGPGDWTI